MYKRLSEPVVVVESTNRGKWLKGLSDNIFLLSRYRLDIIQASSVSFEMFWGLNDIHYHLEAEHPCF